MAERAIVRDEQQSLGVLVQPSHRKQAAPQLGWKQLKHGIVTLIAACRDNTHRLVEHIVPLCAVALHGAIHRRLRPVGIDLERRILLHGAVHRDASRTNECLHFLAAAAVQVGQQFVQSHLWHFVPSANTFLL